MWSGYEDHRKMALASWDIIQLPKLLGGMGLGNLQHKNSDLLFKWIWRLFSGNVDHLLWSDVIRAKYKYSNENSVRDLIIPTANGPWKTICTHLLSNEHSKQLILNATRSQLGNGESILFWHHVWLGETALKIAFPRLFSISSNQKATISMLGFWDGLFWRWNLEWNRLFRSRDNEEWIDLNNLLLQASLSQQSTNSLAWLPLSSGTFLVKSFTTELVKASAPHACLAPKRLWKNLVPPRIEIFIWLAISEKLNMRNKLSRLNIIHPDHDLCALCSSNSETCTHLFIHCDISYKLWIWWLDLWGIKWVFPNSLNLAFSQWSSPLRGSFFKKVWLASFLIIMWTLWKERNDRIFNNKSLPLSSLQELVLLRLSWWIKGWGEPFPYTSSDILRNPSCLYWNPIDKRSPRSLIPQEILLWSPPLLSTFKWNIDASCNPTVGNSAIGGVLRDSKGNFLCLFSAPIPPMDINAAEVLAIHRAMKITRASENFRDQIITFESDSKNAIQWCTSNAGGPWNLNFVLNYIRTSLMLGNFSLVHKNRESNGAADSLAKQGIHR